MTLGRYEMSVCEQGLTQFRLKIKSEVCGHFPIFTVTSNVRDLMHTVSPKCTKHEWPSPIRLLFQLHLHSLFPTMQYALCHCRSFTFLIVIDSVILLGSHPEKSLSKDGSPPVWGWNIALACKNCSHSWLPLILISSTIFLSSLWPATASFSWRNVLFWIWMHVFVCKSRLHVDWIPRQCLTWSNISSLNEQLGKRHSMPSTIVYKSVMAVCWVLSISHQMVGMSTQMNYRISLIGICNCAKCINSANMLRISL